MTEHDIQSAFFSKCETLSLTYPEFNKIYAIPNGGLRNKIVARKLKKEGVKSGIPDVFVAVPRNGYHGLYIEFKCGKNKLTKNQAVWFEKLSECAYKCEVCYSSIDAINILFDYLNIERKK